MQKETVHTLKTVQKCSVERRILHTLKRHIGDGDCGTLALAR